MRRNSRRAAYPNSSDRLEPICPNLINLVTTSLISTCHRSGDQGVKRTETFNQGKHIVCQNVVDDK
jgi:hypothetical protein